MSAKQVFYLMASALSLLFIGGAATVVYGYRTLNAQGATLVDLKLENRLLEEQQDAIKKASQEVQKYEDLEQIAKSIVPQDKDQAKAIREIVAIAAGANMSILSISFDNSTLGIRGTASSPTAAQSAPLSITQAKPVSGLPGTYSIDMTIVPAGGYHDFLSFLEGLENNRRTAQVTGVSVKPRTNGSVIIGYDFSLGLSIFINPGGGQ